jgi:hypothetical protein
MCIRSKAPSSPLPRSLAATFRRRWYGGARRARSTQSCAIGQIRRIADGVYRVCGAQIDTCYGWRYLPTLNVSSETDAAAATAAFFVGASNVGPEMPSSTAAEDFARFLEEKSGAYGCGCRIGAVARGRVAAISRPGPQPRAEPPAQRRAPIGRPSHARQRAVAFSLFLLFVSMLGYLSA